MNETAISWTDVTWNPASGCQKVSDGCKYCYASSLAENKRGTPAFPNGFDLTIRPHKLREPFALKKPSLVFVNSMSDLFWDKIPTKYVDKVVDVIEQTPQHQYQVLTKRPERMLAYSKRRKLPWNFWAGATVEDCDRVDRIDILREVDASLRFISIEPLLSPIAGALKLDGIDWVIVGGESGTHLSDPDKCRKHGLVWKYDSGWAPRPECVEWVRDILDECQQSATTFFFKQWGGLRPTSNGNLLDGKVYHDFPRTPEARPQNTTLPHGETSRLATL
jgi:protein gp37